MQDIVEKITMIQPSFFDTENRLKKLNEKDNLLKLNKLIDWEQFRSTLELARNNKPRKSNAGRKSFDSVLMFKCLILQHLYNLSDEELEFQLRDRLTFMRFVGLKPEDTTPDCNTLWDFREFLTTTNTLKPLFEIFTAHLNAQGFTAKKGQIIDASFVEAPRQRNTREQNDVIKQGLVPAEFAENPAVQSQKDLDARWAKKNNAVHYGYKNHINIDAGHKIIRDFSCTSAEVHDSNEFETLLTSNSNQNVWADSAYRSNEKEMILDILGYKSQVHKKGTRAKPLTEKQTLENTKKSKIRARVEHVFGHIKNSLKGNFVRVIGVARATAKITLTNLTYNIDRFCYLQGVALSKK